MYYNNTQFPRKAQQAQNWQYSDYISSLWFNAIHTYQLTGEDAAEYVRIEQRLDAIEHSPFLESRIGERKALMTRHAELTAPKNATN